MTKDVYFAKYCLTAYKFGEGGRYRSEVTLALAPAPDIGIESQTNTKNNKSIPDVLQ